MTTVSSYPSAIDMATLNFKAIRHAEVTSFSTTQIIYRTDDGETFRLWGSGFEDTDHDGVPDAGTVDTLSVFSHDFDQFVVAYSFDTPLSAPDFFALLVGASAAQLAQALLAGDDQVTGSDFADTLVGGAGADEIFGGGGDDFVDAGAGADTVLGGDGADRVLAGADNDYVSGQGGQDTLLGGKGSDTLSGGDGDDSLMGGGAHDYLSGAAGADILAGGAGADTFAFGALSDSTKAAADRILDLNNHDLIDLSQIDADAGADGDQAFVLVRHFDGVAGEITLAYKADETILRADVDGDGKADMVILIDGDHTDFTNFAL